MNYATRNGHNVTNYAEGKVKSVAEAYRKLKQTTPKARRSVEEISSLEMQQG